MKKERGIRLGKVYYWIKLKMEFFDKRIKKLRRIAGGDTCTIIYLKMLLLSLPDEGVLYYDGIEDDFAEEIALELDEETENVRMTISYLLSKGLMEKRSKYEYYLNQVSEMLGKEVDSAARVRKHRKKMAEKRYNVTDERYNVQNCNTEIDIEKQKEKHIELHTEIEEIDTGENYAGERGNVILLDREYKQLRELFPNDYRERVDRLSRYIASSGKEYTSHFATIVRWAKEDEERERKKADAESKPDGSFETDSFFEAALQRTYGER